MTVVPAIGTGTGKTFVPGPANQPKGMFESGRSRVATQSDLSSPGQENESFRKGWQSLLTTMTADLQDSGQGISATGQKVPSSEETLAEAAGNFTASTSTPERLKDSNAGPATEIHNKELNAETRMSSSSAKATESTATPVVDSVSILSTGGKPASTNAEERISEAGNTTRKSRADLLHNNTGKKLASTESIVDLVTASRVTAAQISPNAASTSPVALLTNFNAQSVPPQSSNPIAQSRHADTAADILADSSAGLTSASLIQHPLPADRSVKVDGVLHTAAKQSINGAEAPIDQKNVGMADSQSRFGAPAQTATVSIDAQENAEPSILLLPKAGNSPDLLAMSQPSTQTATPGSSLYQAATEQAAFSSPASSELLSGHSELKSILGQTIAKSQLGQAPALHQSQEQVAVGPANYGLNFIAASISRAKQSSSPEITNPAATPSVQHSSALPRYSGEQVPLRGGKIPAVNLSRSVREAGSIDLIESGRPIVNGLPFAQATDEFAISRFAENPNGATAPVLAAVPTGPDSREAFAALDAAGTAGNPPWFHAGAQRAEAGFQDPTLGWVSVRADMSRGGVHAELVPGSTDAAQALSGHLAGLNAYLSEHHTAVESVTVTSPESGWSGFGSGQGTGAETRQETSQQSGQQATQDISAGFPLNTASRRSDSSAATSEPLTGFIGMERGAEMSSPGGMHISVMA